MPDGSWQVVHRTEVRIIVFLLDRPKDNTKKGWNEGLCKYYVKDKIGHFLSKGQWRTYIMPIVRYLHIYIRSIFIESSTFEYFYLKNSPKADEKVPNFKTMSGVDLEMRLSVLGCSGLSSVEVSNLSVLGDINFRLNVNVLWGRFRKNEASSV